MAPTPGWRGTNEESEGKGSHEGEEGEEEEEEADMEENEADEAAPTHLPLACGSELLDTDISTTVDPSYVISLIRQLLPHDLREGKQCQLSDCKMKQEPGNGERSDDVDDRQPQPDDTKDPWEDCGCILWDLSTNKSHAELMVSNLILEVLLANLHVTDSFRLKEICLGIIGNLACHETLSTSIVSANGLIATIINQLYQDDSACLSETFRLLSVSLRSVSFDTWAKALLPDQILSRILWIIGNTLNSRLLEKSIDFLLTIIYKQEVRGILLQPLMKLGLPDLAVSLLESEIKKSEDEFKLERFFVLDLILQLVEALSTVDKFSNASNDDLFSLVCEVVKLPDKIEVLCPLQFHTVRCPSSQTTRYLFSSGVNVPDKPGVSHLCASAVVIIANILADEPDLMLGILNDFQFLKDLIDVLPFANDDSQTRSAFWTVLDKLLLHIEENVNVSSNVHQSALILLDKSSLIEDDLDHHALNNCSDNPCSDHGEGKTCAVATSLKRIANIVEKVSTEKAANLEKCVSSNEIDDGAAQKLLHYCRRYGSHHAP